MNSPRLTLALGLAALLGGTLALPSTASAHDRDSSRHYDSCCHHGERFHNRGYKKMKKHLRRHHQDDWYMARHRELRRHRHHHDVYQPQEHHGGKQHHNSNPLEIGIRYKIVL